MIKKESIIESTVTDLAFGGRGIVKIDGFPIFVDGALPGQEIKLKITTKKRRYAEAKLLKVLKKSDLEIEIPYQNTPGAPWANLPIELQKKHKQAQVEGLFSKFAHTDLKPIFDTYIESPLIWEYRNKMDYSFGPTEETQNEEGEWQHTGFGLGSKKRGQFWLVENLEKASGMFDQEFEAKLKDFRIFCETLNSSVYNARKGSGFWRQLVVKKSFHENKFLINIITNIDEENTFNSESAINFFIQNFPDKIKGIYWTQSDDLGNANDKYKSRDLLWGEEVLVEKINDLVFQLSIDSFFQTNPRSAEELYKKALSYIDNKSAILELFAGTGTISQIIAQNNPESNITSVEIIESAVLDAKKNAQRNNINHINFICDDVNKFMKTYSGNPPTVVLDPPRAGISPKALQRIADFSPQEIIYISCNPATLARDAEILQKNNFVLEKISLVDQFPHTSHVECVTKFRLQN